MPAITPPGAGGRALPAELGGPGSQVCPGIVPETAASSGEAETGGVLARIGPFLKPVSRCGVGEKIAAGFGRSPHPFP